LQKWKLGVVSEKIGYRTYLVRLESGQSIKRSIDQFQGTEAAAVNTVPEMKLSSSKSTEVEDKSKQKSVTF